MQHNIASGCRKITRRTMLGAAATKNAEEHSSKKGK